MNSSHYFLESLKAIPEDKIPKHICIIPDGNGRWAKQLGKKVIEGHKKGAEVTKNLLKDLSTIEQIKTVTVWGFSSDNWKRSKEEVEGLMRLFEYQAKHMLNEIQKRKGRFIHLGRKDRLTQKLRKLLEDGEEKTKDNTGQIVAIAIDFGGEDQVIRMLQMARENKSIEITTDTLWEFRDGKGVVKAADLLIRTSGEKRTSDIGWLNGAQTELYFIDKLYPTVTTENIINAIIDFSQRERRMGARK